MIGSFEKDIELRKRVLVLRYEYFNEFSDRELSVFYSTLEQDREYD